MTKKQALGLIKSMACLRDYPKGYPDAEAKLADRLMQASEGDLKLATAIVERFDQQCPTIAELQEAARSVRGIIALLPNGFQEYEKAAIECQSCQDTGVIKQPGGFMWCTCDQARALEAEVPKWLNTLNQFEKKIS